MKKLLRITALAIAFALGVTSAQADTSTTPAKKESDDILFKALQDEMARNKERLKLGVHSQPYFLQYKVLDSETCYITASCGALAQSRTSRSRYLYSDVRIGDYNLDSSRKPGNLDSLFGSSSMGVSQSLPIEDDYYALRHQIWLASDRAYKKAIESYEDKKANLKAHPETDRLGDFTKEKPVVFLKPAVSLKLDKKKWEDTCRKLSEVFVQYPEIEYSVVTFTSQAGNAWLVNNEGFKHRDGKLQTILSVFARIRAKDGRPYCDAEFMAAESDKELPDIKNMEKSVKDLVARLKRTAEAPLAKAYSGPILLEPEASAPVLYMAIANMTAAAHEKSESSSLFRSVQPSRHKINQRVSSRLLTVVDDPAATTYKGAPLLGNYEVDDDGMPAQKITLIEKGILKNFCTSRIPTPDTSGSNGHSLNGVGSVSVLFVSAEPSLQAKRLKRKLMDLGKEQGYDEVYIIKRIVRIPSWLSSSDSESSSSFFSKLGGDLTLYPTEVYRVSLKTGKEELVRGGRLSVQMARVLRDITCAGDDERACSFVQDAMYVSSLVVPSIVLYDADLKEPAKSGEKPPVLESPLTLKPQKSKEE